MAPPNSAYEAAPVHASNPDIVHTIRDAPGDPTCELTCAGEENIPEPMIKPTTRDNPFRYVKVLFFSRFCSEPRCRSSETADGFPSAVYPPPAVDESGNRAGVKSKAEDIEYDLPPRRASRVAGLASCKGSSFSSDILREDPMPERDEVSELGSSSWSESAREASSRESRPGSCSGFWISEKPGGGIMREGVVDY